MECLFDPYYQNVIEAYAGNDFSIDITVDEDDEPILIKGYVFYFTAKSLITDSDDDAILKKDVEVEDNDEPGFATIAFTAADTADIPEGYYQYDIQVKDTFDRIQTFARGELVLKNRVTGRV